MVWRPRVAPTTEQIGPSTVTTFNATKSIRAPWKLTTLAAETQNPLLGSGGSRPGEWMGGDVLRTRAVLWGPGRERAPNVFWVYPLFLLAILLGRVWSGWWALGGDEVVGGGGARGAKGTKKLVCREFGARWPIVRRAGAVLQGFGSAAGRFFRGRSACRCGEPSQGFTEAARNELFEGLREDLTGSWAGPLNPAGTSILRSTPYTSHQRSPQPPSASTWLCWAHAKRAMTSNRACTGPLFPESSRLPLLLRSRQDKLT